jgi:hypothetical protein
MIIRAFFLLYFWRAYSTFLVGDDSFDALVGGINAVPGSEDSMVLPPLIC